MTRHRRWAAAIATSLVLVTGAGAAICGNSWYRNDGGVATNAGNSWYAVDN